MELSADLYRRATGTTTLQPRLMTLQDMALPAEHLVLQLKPSRSPTAASSTAPLQLQEALEASAEEPKQQTAPAGGLRPSHAPSMISRASLVCAWGVANMALLLSNRGLLMQADFQQPVFLTLCHMGMSSLVPAAIAVFRREQHAAPSRRQLLGIGALAAVFSASVIMGNAALRWVHVSFFQAIGATTPAFVAALAFVLLRQQERWRVYASLLPVIVGLVIATGGEPSFHVLGFAATVAATVLRALKTVMQGMLLKDVEPAVILRHMAMFATLILMAATAVLEHDVLWRLPPLSSMQFYAILLLNCSLAIVSNFLNMLVTKAIGPLSLQVFGNLFGVASTVFSIAVFRNPVSVAGMCGYAMSISGVLLYTREKHSESRHNIPQPKAHNSDCGLDAA